MSVSAHDALAALRAGSGDSAPGPTREELTEDPRIWMNEEIDRLRAERDALRAAAPSPHDETLRAIEWLIDCERDGAETNGHVEAVTTCDNIRRRIAGHFAAARPDSTNQGDAE